MICAVPGLTKLMDPAGDPVLHWQYQYSSAWLRPAFLPTRAALRLGRRNQLCSLSTTDAGQSPPAHWSAWYVAMRTPDSSCANGALLQGCAHGLETDIAHHARLRVYTPAPITVAELTDACDSPAPRCC